MKIKNVIILIFLLCFSIDLFAQHIFFENTYLPPSSANCHNSNSGVACKSIAICADSNIMVVGNCMVAGDTCSTVTAGNIAIRLLKLTPNGDTILSKIYMPPINNVSRGSTWDASEIIRTFDNNFIIIGSIEIGAFSAVNAFMLKIDPAGSIIWEKEYYSGTVNYFYNIIETSDHGYLAGGTTNGGNQIIYVVKTDSLGNELWNKSYNIGSFGGCSSLINNQNGTYSIIGESMPVGYSLYKDIIINIDTLNGSEISHYYYGDVAHNPNCSKGILTSNSNYLLVGNENGLSRGRHLQVIKADNSGNIIWDKLYGNDTLENYTASDVIEISDGFIITGRVTFLDTVQGSSWLPAQGFIAKIDNNGVLQCKKILGSPTTNENNVLYAIAEYFNNDYIVAGGNYNGYVVRFDDSYICSITGIEDELNSSLNFNIFPNPCSNGAITLEINNEYFKTDNYHILIYNVLGDIVYRSPVINNSTQINLITQPKGVFFVQLLSDKNIVGVKKIIID